MFILRDLSHPLQAHFSDTDLARERSSLFAYSLLAVIVPFTSSITSNCLRSLVTLFGIEIKKKRFYTFMASTITWLYADRLKADPERRHKVKGRTGFAFSDVRRLIAEAALNDDFDRFPPNPAIPQKILSWLCYYAGWPDEF